MTGPSSTPPTVSNQQAWQSYVEYTGTTSKIARQAAFALGGAAWLLRSDDGQLTGSLVVALGLLIGFFALDIAQYAVGGELRRRWIESREKELHTSSGSLEGEYQYPRSLDQAARYIYWAKLVALALGAVALIAEVIQRFT